MKKFILLAIVLLAAGFLAWKLLSDKPVNTSLPANKPLTISKNTPQFDTTFSQLLNSYYLLHDALVDWDTGKADQAAYVLAAKADSLPLKGMKADSGIVLTAQSLAASLSGDAKGFVGEAGIEGRRHSFDLMTDELYNLIRTVRYDQAVIYHIKCPMAFSDTIPAYWISNSSTVLNPYLGSKHPVYKNKMLHCGELVDSFDLTKK
ncbi:DUF3347 domain-containing protein [Puia sp.]|jgi:hypothetical protein|uniref:DUF3347 domain-containing protein n=1 Tax=Puia sp. TaxID=2045100 RepID=UPI002F41CD7F